MLLRHVVLFSCALLSACSHYNYHMGESLSRQQMPDKNLTLKLADVLQQLGPPLRISATVSGYVLAWEHWDISETKVGITLGFAGVDAFSIDWGSSTTSGEFLLLGFNHKHELTDTGFTEWDHNAGGGQAIQPFGGLLSVVDVDDLLNRMPQHNWGATSLNDLPTTLNVDNQPDTGQNGIEQRGTPTGVGQRSLEMN